MADDLPLLVVDNITVHRGGVPIIENASLTMEAGEFVGIVGRGLSRPKGRPSRCPRSPSKARAEQGADDMHGKNLN